MKASLTVATGVVAAVALLAVSGPTLAAASKNTNSEKVATLLKPAQEALKAKNYSAAMAKVHEAEALAEKTPFDQYTISEFGCSASAGSGNYPDAAKYCEQKLNSSFMPEGEAPGLTKTLVAINYQIKNYDKTIELGNKAIKGGYATDEIKNVVAQSYYLKGDWKGTLGAENVLVDDEIKEGHAPKEQQLGLMLNSCLKLDDEACQEKALEKYVQYYPKPEYWAFLLAHVRQSSTGDSNNLQILRLMADTDSLKDPGDWNEAAQLAVDAGSPGEAQRILEKGFAANVFTDQRSKDRNTRLLESVKKAATADQASLAKGEADANAASTGQKNAAVGLAYFGYGQYDKAVDQLQKGLTKGGLKNTADTKLLLGIAQYKAGHKDDALKTFKTVKDDQNKPLERLAYLWTLHVRSAAS